MWKFKPFMAKENNGLEGRVIDIGNFKVQVRNAIAEGGFSCVYLARDAIHGSKQYALKHIICNDMESQELVVKEISVMKSLKGHPNVVTLCAHAFFEMGRTKEALLLMEYCEKSLVNVLENRGSGFFEEKQILRIFRDICNAVFAMHCQTPPIAHRDLKAENILLGSDGLWKLCDFGSISTNHKRFEKPEEMGIEEDNIRKHTTPAYRAPEMWDLFRRDLINEKVDIWALGCLLFRIAYFKLAFDGESKLQILNGNYRIPDLPKYSTSQTELIRDMLQSSPDDRPDITQVWFRVNGLLPDGLQKSLPDTPPEMQKQSSDVLAGMQKPTNKSNPTPRRNPPPSSETPQHISSVSKNTKTGENTPPLGAFWVTQHANSSTGQEEKTNKKLPTNDNNVPFKHPPTQVTQQKEFQSPQVQKNPSGGSVNKPNEINLFPDNSNHYKETSPPKNAYNAFVAEFDTNMPSPNINHQKSNKELEAEVENLKNQLARINAEKTEITFKYEKLTAICRSQRQEIQDLKQTLAAKTPSPSTDSTPSHVSPGNQPSITPPNPKIQGTVWELEEGFYDRKSPSPDPEQWRAFSEDPKPNSTPESVKATNGHQNSGSSNTWGFETTNFQAVPTASSKLNVPMNAMNNSQLFINSKTTGNKVDSKPSGWAGF